MAGGWHLGDVEFTCECGNGTFLNSTDNRSDLAHCIPDQRFDEFSRMLDDAIENPSRNPEEACLRWRSFQMLKLWQCPGCGAMYFESADRQRYRFIPESDSTPKRLLMDGDTGEAGTP